MPFFQNLSKRVSEAAKEVTKRTADATEAVKLNARSAAVQDEIERLFNQIGKAYYAMRNASGDSDAAKALCGQVDKLQREHESIKNELDRIRNLRRCPNCGEIQANSALFCASCGTKMPVVEAVEPEPEPEPIAPEALGSASAPRSASEAPDVTIDWPKPDAADIAPAGAAPEVEHEFEPEIESEFEPEIELEAEPEVEPEVASEAVPEASSETATEFASELVPEVVGELKAEGEKPATKTAPKPPSKRADGKWSE